MQKQKKLRIQIISKEFTQRYDTLEPEQKQAVNTMLWYSDEMREAHSMKEWFFKVSDTKDISEMKQDFKNWLNSVDTTD